MSHRGGVEAGDAQKMLHIILMDHTIIIIVEKSSLIVKKMTDVFLIV
jgi:hypothetical protein